MSRVTIDVTYTELEGDYGPVEGIIVTCSKCGHSVEVFGTSDRSIYRGAIGLREECPNGENNFYEEG